MYNSAKTIAICSKEIGHYIAITHARYITENEVYTNCFYEL